MGLFDGWRQSRKLKQAESKAHRDASPVALTEYVDALIEAEELEDAREVALRGRRDFPQAESVAEVFERLVRVENQEELVRLRSAVRGDETATAAYELAKLYREMNEDEQANDLCRRGIEKHPEFQGYYEQLADFRRERFWRNGLERDGVLAAEWYEKAIDCNRDNFRVLLRASEFYIRAGIRDHAIDRCQWALEVAPENDRALDLLEQAKALPAQKEGKDLAEIFRTYDIEQRSKRVSERLEGVKPDSGGGGGLAIPHSLAERYAKVPDQLAHRLRTLQNVEGFERLIAIAGNSDTAAQVPENADSGADGEDPVALVKKLFEAAEECSLRMDISELRRGLFEGEGGKLFLYSYDGIWLAVFCRPDVKVDRVEQHVRHVLEHDLHL